MKLEMTTAAKYLVFVAVVLCALFLGYEHFGRSSHNGPVPSNMPSAASTGPVVAAPLPSILHKFRTYLPAIVLVSIGLLLFVGLLALAYHVYSKYSPPLQVESSTDIIEESTAANKNFVFLLAALALVPAITLVLRHRHKIVRCCSRFHAEHAVIMGDIVALRDQIDPKVAALARTGWSLALVDPAVVKVRYFLVAGSGRVVARERHETLRVDRSRSVYENTALLLVEGQRQPMVGWAGILLLPDHFDHRPAPVKEQSLYLLSTSAELLQAHFAADLLHPSLDLIAKIRSCLQSFVQYLTEQLESHMPPVNLIGS